MDLIISTPEELRAFIPAHDYRNLDTIRGFLINSQNTFLRQRIGQPLLTELLSQYGSMTSNGTDPSDLVFDAENDSPWRTLILLAQRVIVYDAFGRSADIRAVNDNDMGLNVAESDSYDAANDKRIERYKLQMQKEAHSAVDMLLLQLEEWQMEIGKKKNEEGNNESIPADGEDDNSSLLTPDSSLPEIVTLWQQSPTYYLNNGLLFNTATEFNLYVDIYESRDRFITLLPDIRYCQELHLEAEIGPELLSDLIDKHRAGSLNPKEQKAYIMLQRTLSLYVEARSKMFSRADAKDEATGYMHLTLDFIRRNQADFTLAAVYPSPLFDFRLWPKDQLKEFFEETQIAIPAPIHHYLFEVSDSGQHTPCHAADPYCREPGGPSIHQGHRHKPGMIAPPDPSCNGSFHHSCPDGRPGAQHGHWTDGENHGGFLSTSMI